MADKIEHISESDVLNAGREKINKFAIDPALRAEENSLTAKNVANQSQQISTDAKDIAKNTDGRLDNIVAGEMQDAEVIDARKPFGAGTYETLSKRLDEQIGKNSEFRNFENDVSFMQRIYNENAEREVNAKWIGVKLDGITDDTKALNQAIQFCGDNDFDLFIPSGKSMLSGDIILQSNVNIRMTDTTTLYNPSGMWRGMNYSKGYGGGINNVKISGGILSGDYAKGAAGNFKGMLQHAKNVVFDNVKFYQCCGDSHAIDLCGCTDITIKNCKFIGKFLDTESRRFSEAIQFDYASEEGVGNLESEINYTDGLPTKNIVVENCEFLSERDSAGTILYYAPSVGQHDAIQGFPIHDITIKNCVFENVIQLYSYTSTDFTAKKLHGWIHFVTARNVVIHDNTFTNSEHTIGTAIQFITFEDETSFIGNFDIKRNSFNGFYGRQDLGGIVEVTTVLKTSELSRLYENIIIDSNEFNDCWNYNLYNGGGNYNLECILLQNVLTANIINNIAHDIKRLVLITPESNFSKFEDNYEYSNINISNNVAHRTNYCGIAIMGTEINATISSNNMTGLRAVGLYSITPNVNMTVTGNNFSCAIKRGIMLNQNSEFENKLMKIRGSENKSVVVTGNTFRDEKKQMAYVVQLATESQENIIVANNYPVKLF